MAKPLEMLRDHSGIFVKQTRKGCVQELMGCEATNEFKIFPNKDAAKDASKQFMYSLEESTCFMRQCFGSNRSFTQTVWSGSKDAKGSVVLTLDRPLACAMQPCCCINSAPFMQTINFGDGDSPIGSAEVPCFFALPAIKIKDEAGKEEYDIHMPSCCGGMCVNPMAEGLCNLKIPFYIYAPNGDSEKKSVGKIIKMWRGFGTEMFTDAASFQIEYPTDADAKAKARLLGATFFINILFFESKNEKN